MIKIFKCRRSSLALIAMGLLTWISLKNGTDVSIAVAGIAAGVAASNSFEKSRKVGE